MNLIDLPRHEQEKKIHAFHFPEEVGLVGLMKHGLWYRPEAEGYTANVLEAGRFTREEAAKHEYPRKGSQLEKNLKSGVDRGICLDPVTIVEFETPRFFTDYAQALRLLERIIPIGGEGDEIRLEKFCPTTGPASYRVCPTGTGGGGSNMGLPAAIAMAALGMVDGELLAR